MDGKHPLLDLSLSDQVMMEEILEMLAADDCPGNDPPSAADPPVDPSATTATNSGDAGASYAAEPEDGRLRTVPALGGPMDPKELQTDCPIDASRAMAAAGEPEDQVQKRAAEQRPEQEQTAAAVGRAAQMPLSMASPLMSLAHAAVPTARPALLAPLPESELPPVHWYPDPSPPASAFTGVGLPHPAAPMAPAMAAATPVAIPAAARAAVAPSWPPSAAPLPPPPAVADGSAAEMTTASNVLPTGQRVHVVNAAEFDDLRRKARMQIASRRYRKRKKEEARQQKQQIQQMQTELARLQEMETHVRQFERQPLASLEADLATQEQEVAALSDELHAAALEELNWVNKINSNLRK